MSTDLLAISNIFAGTSGIGPEPVKPTSTGGSKQFSPSAPDNTPLTDTQGTETADNTYVDPQNEPQNGIPPECDPAPDAKAPQKGQNSKNGARQNLTQIPAEQPSFVQIWLTQYSLNIEQGKEGVAKKVKPKAGYELAQSLTNLKRDGFPSSSGKTAKPHEITPPLTIDQNQIGLKTASTKTSKAPLATRGPTNQQSGKGPTLKSPVDAQSGTNTANGKPAVAGKPVVPVSLKVTALNASFSPVQDKSSYLQSQPIRIGPEKSTLFVEKAAGNKTITSQQSTILPEPSVDNKAAGKLSHPGPQPLAEESVEQGSNSLGNLAPQKLHQAQLHVSTGQTKEHGGSASNNKSDSGFEQIISANNTATSIEEQSLPFPNSVTTDNLPVQTSPSDVSAGITKQILEYIQSYPSQESGTQQITIRLNPPELGRVFIKFEELDNQITGLLQVSKAQTRYEVEQTLPQIIQNLADSGIQVKRLEVVLTDQGEQQPYRDELLQDGTFQQNHEFSQENNPDGPGFTGTDGPVIGVNSNSYQDGLEPQIQITDNSINILI